MGYDLHITRAPNCHEYDQKHEISEEEWLALVGEDSDLRPATSDDVYYCYGMVHWSGSDEDGPWLCWRRGTVYSKNPNAAIIAKMLEVADKLNARVQGDDCEIYLPHGRILNDDGSQMNWNWQTNEKMFDEIEKKKNPWWKFW